MKKNKNRRARKILSTSLAVGFMSFSFLSTQAGAQGPSIVTGKVVSQPVKTASYANVLADKPFVISDGAIDFKGGVKASVTVTPTEGHEGDEVVIFQLMNGTTPAGIAAVETDINSAKKFTAHFNVSGASYTVKAFVVDNYNGSLTEVGNNLADPVIVTNGSNGSNDSKDSKGLRI